MWNLLDEGNSEIVSLRCAECRLRGLDICTINEAPRTLSLEHRPDTVGETPSVVELSPMLLLPLSVIRQGEYPMRPESRGKRGHYDKDGRD